jgi:hypothetical protein
VPDTGPAHPAAAVIELRGELDITAAAALGAAVSAAVDREPVIAIDLTPRHPWGSTSVLLPFWVMTWTV